MSNFRVASGYDISKYDKDLVKQVQRGKQWGPEDQKRYDAAVSAKKKAQTVKTAQTKASSHTGSTVKPENAVDQSVTGKADSAPSNQTINQKPWSGNPAEKKGSSSSSQQQNINQDNDITSHLNGNNNTVINEQDNSIRQYGGDSRSFTYNGGRGLTGGDSPVSMATMAGFYAPDDSPAAQAGRYDLWSTLNSDAQKRYAGDAMKTFAKYGNMDARSYTDESMENTLNRGIQYSFDRADRQTGHVFGDIWNDDYITEEWKMPSAPKPIESNAAEIADKAKDDIEDI